MVDFSVDEVLNLYLLLSDRDNLSHTLEKVLIKLEDEVYSNYTVKEIENFRSLFCDKGVV